MRDRSKPVPHTGVDVNEQLRVAMPFGAFLGLEVVSASADEVRARLAWADELCTAAGSSTAAR